MSTPEISQVLSQMRVMAAQAQNSNAIEPSQGTASNFQQLLSDSINNVNEMQQNSGALKTSFERGEEGVDLAQVMIASQKASVSFSAMVEVRNKLIDAYKDIKNMPI